MCQAKNNYIIPSMLHCNVKAIIVEAVFKNYNAVPLLQEILEDFDRPQEFAKWLKHLLKSDKNLQKKLRKNAKNCKEDEYQQRRFFIKKLAKGIKAGIPVKSDGTD
ncbi:hypothetical protein AHMF7605_22400 [Adhaeribacter arboris]|uniref:Uncharacterized protein n=1 Tax=Adhaeribacter arboris TaxID=2072846 RepID=A0A2T2YKM1_9BACT|nr:hypothetical protein [Adhaeribacter arboris]PSR56052.1 hypothetical protein AHMF7605_22400 [Adhaeribacter arboris]